MLPVQKVRLAINVIILLLFSVNCKSQSNLSSDDELLFNTIFERTKVLRKVNILQFKKSNDNSYVIDYLKLMRKFDEGQEIRRLDSLKFELGIKDNNLIFKSIFNSSEYNNFISQHCKAEWSFQEKLKNETKYEKNHVATIFISKPIYTKDFQTALVGIKVGGASHIGIYKRENNSWQEIAIIAAAIQ
jgi:uncharacterized LabA/DUF88 family protein